MQAFSRVSASCVVTVALTGAAFAQAPGQVKKETRAPNQVVETGHQDDALVTIAGQQVHIDPQTGRMRQPTPAEAAALAAALEQQFGKRVEGVTITYLPNGAVAAQLDDSFMEAITITRHPDGSLQFGHVTGLDEASRAVSAGEASKEPATTSSPQKAAQPKPGAPKQPVVEETE
jgi:hypothetical protein